MANYLPWDDDPHINNGIPNKAFYLVAAGDATAQGIDTQLAGKLWYEALLIMKPRSNFKDLYKAVHKKAVELTGEHVLPSYTVDAVDNAFKTVGII